MTTTMTFEDRLLARLQDVVAANPTPAPSRAHGRRAPRLALAAGGVVGAAVAVALATAGGDSGSAKAYDVVPGDDGAVSVTIRSLDDARGLQDSLRAAGVPAVVCPGQAAPGPPPSGGPATAVAPGGPEAGATTSRGDDGGPSHVKAGVPPAGAPGGDGTRPAGAPAHVRTTVGVRAADDGAATFTIHRGEVPAGARLYISTAGAGARRTVAVAVGEGAPCSAPPVTTG